jgi:hypothetical protein
MTATLFNANVAQAADRIAAADHIPAAYAHDIVSATAPLMCATKLREIAATAHQTVNTLNGCYRVVRVDDLVRIAGVLDAEADQILRTVVAATTTRHHHEESEADRLRAEVATLRRQRAAIVEELAHRRLLECDRIGEHPLTPDQKTAVADECRAYWLHLGEA